MIRFHRGSRYRHRHPSGVGGQHFRLGVLIGLLALVCMLMREARNPANYRWLTQWETGPQEAPPPQPLSVDGSTRSRKSAATDDPSSTGKQILDDEPAGPQPPTSTSVDRVWQELADDLKFRDLWQDAWDYVLGGLNAEDVNLLGDALLGLRHAQPPPAAWAIALPPVLDQIEATLDRYLDSAQSTMAVPDDNQRAEWQNRLGHLHRIGRQIVVAEVRTYVTQDRPVLAENRRAWFDLWQAALDRKLLQSVQDATFFSNHETAWWFRCWEQSALPRSPIESAVPVLVNDLVAQPQRYRGVNVQLDGEIRLVRQVPAPANPLNIERYYVLWMRTSGSSQPVAAYARRLPQGVTVGPTERMEDSPPVPVTINGIFFKLMSYRSVRGVDVAPVLVVSDVRVLAPVQAPSLPRAHLRPEWIVLTSALMALVVVLWIWRHSSRSGRRGRPFGPRQPNLSNSLDRDDIG